MSTDLTVAGSERERRGAQRVGWERATRRPCGRAPRLQRLPPALALPFLFLLAACGGERTMEVPVPLYGDVPVDYPLDLWDAGVEGETMLRVRITEMGDVDSVQVLTPSGYPAFDSAAVRGARELRYEPARENGKRIRVWARVPVTFTRKTG